MCVGSEGLCLVLVCVGVGCCWCWLCVCCRVLLPVRVLVCLGRMLCVVYVSCCWLRCRFRLRCVSGSSLWVVCRVLVFPYPRLAVPPFSPLSPVLFVCSPYGVPLVWCPRKYVLRAGWGVWGVWVVLVGFWWGWGLARGFSTWMPSCPQGCG